MMRKTLPFLIAILILAFGSCTKEDAKEDLEESLLLSRSFDKELIKVPCEISRLKQMLEGALKAVNDSTLITISISYYFQFRSKGYGIEFHYDDYKIEYLKKIRSQ